jgi:hypothetical protein
MKSILFFLSTLTFSLFAQNKYDEKDLIGFWNKESSTENQSVFYKDQSLKFNSFGYQFQEDNVLTIRAIDENSQCASPLSYKDIKAKWKIINSSRIEISYVESEKTTLHYTIFKLENGIMILNLISENKINN